MTYTKHVAAFVLCALMSLAASGTAHATAFDFSYTGPGVTGSGQFSSADVTSPYTITGITGTANGDAITGLSIYAGADNLLYFPTEPFVDFGGISFSTVSLGDWNIFYDGSAYFILSSIENPGGGPDGLHPIELSITAVTPEPITLSLFGAGLAGAFLVRRRKRKPA
jgi:hypothetical protein